MPAPSTASPMALFSLNRNRYLDGFTWSVERFVSNDIDPQSALSSDHAKGGLATLGDRHMVSYVDSNSSCDRSNFIPSRAAITLTPVF